MEKLYWVDERYDKHYRLARWLIMIFMAVSVSLFIQEIEEPVVVMRETVRYVLITWLLSYPTSSLSMKMINLGDKLNHVVKKVLYYLAMFVVTIIVFVIATLVVDGVGEKLEFLDEFLFIYADFSFVLVFLIITWIAVLMPWVQSVLVLIIRKISKIKPEEA